MFEILEHPADIGFRAFGGTLEELFANAAVAMISIACEIEDVAPRTEYALSATGTDYESMLVNWLSEVLYWFDGKRRPVRSGRGRVTRWVPGGAPAAGAGPGAGHGRGAGGAARGGSVSKTRATRCA